MAEFSSVLGRVAKHVRKRWRKWLRAIHRDAGYLAVGLTVIYAISGIAINHIEDWNPNFENVSRTHHIPLPIPDDEQAAADHVLAKLGIEDTPSYAGLAGNQLEIELNTSTGTRTLVVDTDTGQVFDNYDQPRFFLRIANWLHYNRGKAAWTYIADAYAGFLLFLAISGIFMLKGKLGLRGRGALLIAAGAAVPIVYVSLAGGPGG